MKDFPYTGRYTFVDVEIPNLNNDCICAISLIVCEDGKETLRHTELINPKTFFSANNIEIHHITRKDVLNARTLEEFWKEYGRYFDKPYIIGAHNTKSDMSVLNKDLARFGEKIHATEYVDTMDIMEKFYYRGKQKKGDLKLDHIASHLGIAIDHHNPESDVNVCVEAIKYMAKNFHMDIKPFIKPIPEPKVKPPKEPHKPSHHQMKIFLDYTRKQIADHADNVQMNAKEAKERGDRAFKAQDYEGIVFYYEIAVARHWSTPAVYLRLAQTYDTLHMYYDAIRVLDKGIQTLKASGQNWNVLKGVEQRLAGMQESRLKKQKQQTTRKLLDEARKTTDSRRNSRAQKLKNESALKVKENISGAGSVMSSSLSVPMDETRGKKPQAAKADERTRRSFANGSQSRTHSDSSRTRSLFAKKNRGR